LLCDCSCRASEPLLSNCSCRTIAE
jgi:hypothetical protein